MKARAFTKILQPFFMSLAFLAASPAGQTAPASQKPESNLEFIKVSQHGKGFALAESNRRFTPWGFNYDHDRSSRLIEDYWKNEWQTVASDFGEIKALGANTVRIHLQVARFMNSAAEMNQESLRQLSRLLKLAETNHLYVDITGLGCYRRKDVPQWYNDLDETERWEVQARFWSAVASACSQSPAVFCYDLMNEPIVTEDKNGRDWTPGEFAGMCFVQRLTLDFAGRTEKEIARAWVDKLAAAIRKHDQRHLITVGVIPWALTWPTAKPLFYSNEVSTNLDFVSVHFYPKKGEVDKALKALAVYNIGKPVVIEEIFPLECSMPDLEQFITGSKSQGLATGWIGFYWGKTIAEYREGKGDIGDTLALGWLEYFSKKTRQMVTAAP